MKLQDYSGEDEIEGVKTVVHTIHPGHDGSFEELGRLDNGLLKEFPDFEVKQINRSIILGGSLKAWHVHKKQEDIWYVSPQEHLLAGLWDMREDSPTYGSHRMYVLGGGRATMLYIPRGVAHGAMNVLYTPVTLLYFVNAHFNPKDEWRIHYDDLEGFWDTKHE